MVLEKSSFEAMQNLLLKGMNASNLRYQVVSHNMANSDTPNFKKSKVVFESELRRRLQVENNVLSAFRTHEHHIAFNKKRGADSLVPKVVREYDTSHRNDGNNVVVEEELSKAAKSALSFLSYATLMQRNFRKLKMVIR